MINAKFPRNYFLQSKNLPKNKIGLLKKLPPYNGSCQVAAGIMVYEFRLKIVAEEEEEEEEEEEKEEEEEGDWIHYLLSGYYWPPLPKSCGQFILARLLKCAD